MLINSRILVAVFMFGAILNTIAQKPAWTDYYNRSEMFPDNEYLIGFMSGENTNDEEPGKLKSKFEILAKNKLIQSIQVQVESNTSLNISNVNGKSDEELLSKSVSFSRVNVSGLVTKSYYDRKKKEVYAIAFANKKELLHYYRNLIKSGIQNVRQKLGEGKKYAKSGKKESALKSYYEAMPYLTSIDEARVLLIALNRRIYSEVNNDEILQLNQELNDEISKLLDPGNLTISEAAYFVAYGLYLQTNEIKNEFYLSELTFENTGLKSDFSDSWNKEISSSLIEIGEYRQRTDIGGLTNCLLIGGNYWIEDEMIKISTFARLDDKLIASSKGSLPLFVLKNNGVDHIPYQIHQLKTLNGYSIEVIDFPGEITSGVTSDKPVSIRVSVDRSEQGSSITGFPLIVCNLDNNEILSKGVTNNGEADCYIGRTELQSEILRAAVIPDLASFLDIDYNSEYYLIAQKENPVIPVNINIMVTKPEIFISGKEMIDGKAMEIKFLEPIVKKILSENGYGFVDNPDNADFKVEITSDAVSGGQYQGIYFSYLDVNISVKDQKGDQEIYKNSINQLKGGGSNRLKAAKKAYSVSEKKIENILLESPLIKNID